MAFLKRIGFFILTNLLVMVTIGIVWSLISHFFLQGLDSYIGTLMAFSLVFGMSGAFISLLMSRFCGQNVSRGESHRPHHQ